MGALWAAGCAIGGVSSLPAVTAGTYSPFFFPVVLSFSLFSLPKPNNLGFPLFTPSPVASLISDSTSLLSADFDSEVPLDSWNPLPKEGTFDVFGGCWAGTGVFGCKVLDSEALIVTFLGRVEGFWQMEKRC
jgi:hypothetical protein